MPNSIADVPERITPWFDINDDLPEYIGEYGIEVAATPALGLPERQGFSHWDGQRFGGLGSTPAEALELRKDSPGGRIVRWRGIEVGVRFIARQVPQVEVDESNKLTLAALNKIESRYARFDEMACRDLLFRFETAARRGLLVTYMQLVRGVTFNIPDEEGRSLHKMKIDVYNITAKDEDVILDFAFYLGAASYRDSKALLNALLVTTRAKPKPPSRFYAWAKKIGQRERGGSADEDRAYWQSAVDAVHARYGAR